MRGEARESSYIYTVNKDKNQLNYENRKHN